MFSFVCLYCNSVSGFGPLDIGQGSPGAGNLNRENVSVRQAMGKFVGVFSLLMIDVGGPIPL